MKADEFEQLIEAAGLHLVGRMLFEARFIVCLQVGERFQNDTMSYETADFVQLTPARAQAQIEACRCRLERAAKTQQGVVAYPASEKKIAPKKIPNTHTISTISYPAH